MKTTNTKSARSSQRLMLLFLVSTFLILVGLGCNTAHGFGKDVENAGEKIQNGTK